MFSTSQGRAPPKSAADLMSEGVQPISHDASFSDAVTFLVDHDLHVAPVTGEFGDPVGVVSTTDLLIHVRECIAAGRFMPTTVSELMTGTVFTIAEDATIDAIARDMVRSHVHHLFVTDRNGSIRGVISACDLLRQIE
jgi:predicted transcriptional regulator